MSDAFEYFMIQKHETWEWVFVVVGAFLPFTVMVFWVYIFRHRKKDYKNPRISWREDKNE